jgi:hypothetical protein
MSAKYFKRGTREFFQVTPERMIRIVNKECRRGKVWKVAVPVALVVGFIIGEEL